VTLRIAVPDGALRAPSLQILAAVGVGGGDSPPAASASPGLEARVVVIAADDVPSYLANGVADAGLVAKDVLLERATGLCELLDLRFGGALLVYAAAPGAAARAERLGRLRIATRHPTLTRSYFAARGVEVAVVEVVGALDRAAVDGLADGVVALVEAAPGGAAAPGDAAAPVGSAQAHIEGLTVEGVVAESSVRLVAGRGARVLHSAELGQLVGRLRDLTTKAATT
jgi:ATP phosphoribosyltransferase